MTVQTATATPTVVTATVAAATSPSTSTATRPRRGASITVWVVQSLLAAFFVFAAVPKLLGVGGTVEGFEAMGAGQWFRVVTGLVELAGALGLVIPRLSSLASFGLALVMVCASYINLVVTDIGPASLVGTGTLCALFVWIAWVRRDQNQRLIELIRRVAGTASDTA